MTNEQIEQGFEERRKAEKDTTYWLKVRYKAADKYVDEVLEFDPNTGIVTVIHPEGGELCRFEGGNINDVINFVKVVLKVEIIEQQPIN